MISIKTAGLVAILKQAHKTHNHQSIDFAKKLYSYWIWKFRLILFPDDMILESQIFLSNGLMGDRGKATFKKKIPAFNLKFKGPNLQD